MLQKWLGAEPFREGLVGYLDHFKYNNTVTEDLWQWLGKSSPGKDVEGVMNTWTKQTGYPVLVVTEESSDGKEKVLKIEQKRFLQMGQKVEEGAESLWKCPMTWITSGTSTPTDPVILEKKSDTLRVKIASDEVLLKSLLFVCLILYRIG